MNKGTETETEHPPSEKKRKFTKKDAGGPQTTIKKGRGMRGMLADVKEMPLDILFEIFSRLSPIDLVNLTRTSKDLRAIFTSRSSISVWKAARANIVPAMPDCPDDLSEPQYADLAFGKGCYHCGRNLAIIHTAWLARRRICKKCIDYRCSLIFPDRDMRNIFALNRYLPEIGVPRKSFKQTHYFKEFVKLWNDTHNNITDPKEKESWIVSKCEERKAIKAHALLCATWVEEYNEYQQLLVEQLTTKQLDDIAKRVAYLGWDEEVRKMLASERKFEQQSEVRKMCRKELTDRIWVKLDAQINVYMESVKKRRLMQERLTFLKDRLPILQKVHNDHLLKFSTSERYWYPMASELFLYEPKIQDIVNDTSSTLESMKEQLVLTLPEIYPNAIDQLIRRIDDQLLEGIVASRSGEIIDRKTGLGLATTLFRCSCSKFSRGILRYNEAVLHRCTRMSDFPEPCQDGIFIAKFLGEKYRSHRHDRLPVLEMALRVVPILAKLCGFDPRTATTQMMDDLNPIFECIPCASPQQGRATMTWLRAVFHFFEQNHDFDMEDQTKFTRLNGSEEDAARKRIIEMQERAMASMSGWTNSLIQCAHCSEDIPRSTLMQHVKSAHGIENPTDKDTMLNLDVNHIPDIFYMWPPT